MLARVRRPLIELACATCAPPRDGRAFLLEKELQSGVPESQERESRGRLRIRNEAETRPAPRREPGGLQTAAGAAAREVPVL